MRNISLKKINFISISFLETICLHSEIILYLVCSLHRLASSNFYFLGFSSFSDNNDKLILSDLSSTSSTSETDSKHGLHYTTTVSSTGSIKITEAQLRKHKRAMKIMCNRKINYFLTKYVHIDSSKIEYYLTKTKQDFFFS